MTCDAARDLLLDRAYREIGAADARALEAHLDGCAACRAEARALSGTLAAMRRLPPEEPPGDEGIVLAAAREAAERARARRRPLAWLRLGVATALVVAVGGLSLKLLQPRREAGEEIVLDRGEPSAMVAAPATGARSSEGTEARPAAEPPVAAPFASAPPVAGVRRGERTAERPAAGPSAAAPFASAPPPAAAARRGEGAVPGQAAGQARQPEAAEAPAVSSETRLDELQVRSREAPAKPAAPAAGERAPQAGRAEPGVAAKALPTSDEGPGAVAEALVRELQRRRDAGELNEARRRPDPCPGGDVLRLAWFDGVGRAHRFARTGPTPQGEATRDHYYDDYGRLRLVRIEGTGPAGHFARRIVLDEAGRRVLEDPPGAPWPDADLVRTDPARAFWAPPRCGPGR